MRIWGIYCCFFSLLCWADVVTTKQGIVYKGKILEESATKVTILVEGEKYPVTVLRTFIASIEKDPGSVGATDPNNPYAKMGSPDGVVQHKKRIEPKKSKKLNPARQKELIQLMFKYLYGEPDKRKNLAPLLREYESYLLTNLEKEVVSLGHFTETGGAVQNEPCTVSIEKKDWKGEWTLILPPGYSPKKSTPLLIALHGGGRGVGDNDTAVSLFQSHALSQKWILLAPTIMRSEYKGNKDMWNTGISEEYVFILMQRVIEKYNVDLNRIYVAGHSMGGFGTWHFTALNTDIFAAGGAASGGPDAAKAERNNFSHFINMPIYFVHGKDDTQVLPAGDQAASKIFKELQSNPPIPTYPDDFKKSLKKGNYYPHTYVEINGYGHACPDSEIKKMIQWMADYKRDLYPKKVVVQPWNVNLEKRRFPRHQRNTWLEIQDKITEIKDIQAQAEVHGNTILIDTQNCTKVAVYLHDALVNLDEPVQIYVNGREVFHSVVDRNLVFALNHILETQDRGRFFTSVVVLDTY